jgi:hypothetical protein
MTVEFSSTGGLVTLEHTIPTGATSVINFEMNGAAGRDLFLGELVVGNFPGHGGPQTLQSLNINSTGAATDNVIEDASLIGANINVAGATHLSLGRQFDGYPFTGNATAGAVIDASTQTGGVEAWLANIGFRNFPTAPSQTFIGGSGNDTVHLENSGATVVDFSKGGKDIVDFHLNSVVLGGGFLVDNSQHVYTSVTGWTTANDTIHIVNDHHVNNLQFTDGGFVFAGSTTNILTYSTGSIEDASTVADNYIKITTPTTTTGATAAEGLNSAIGAGGSITTAAPNESYLTSYYDSTHGQAVFLTAESNAAGVINDTLGNLEVGVVGLFHMSAADYAALGPSSLHFT